MRHREIADIVLTGMLNGRGTSPWSLSEALMLDRDLVKETLEDLKLERGFMFEHTKGFGNHEFHMILKDEWKSRLKSYLKAGGFTHEVLQQFAQDKQKRIDEDEERTLRQVTIAQAKKAMEDSDKALDLAEKAIRSSQESNAIAHDSNIIANNASKKSLWSGIGGAAIGSIVMWLLTKHCS